ncbi:selenophosphate synthase [Nitzschia inconspicua]|uniref:Selenophosphate synthase n=1 Tax=Nitzschia inconspicua TaxID=303405 RepID=A0A9K3LKV2_9STRA|nr:selenophosphate synthase [Nitzschia inconspicua]
MDDRKKKRLALVGAGYSNLQVLRLLATSDAVDSITLIDPNSESVYCGSIPENISNFEKSKFPKPEWRIDLKNVCQAHDQRDKIQFVQGEVVDIDLANRCIYLNDGMKTTTISYDLVAIDIGSKSKSITDIPGAFENVIPTRPMKILMDRLDEIEKNFFDDQQNCTLPVSDGENLELEQPPLNIAVVGGGASGIELALSIVGRWRPMLQGRVMNVRLVTSDHILLPEIAYARKRLKDILADRGIYMIFQSAVDRVDDGCLHLESGMTVPFSYCFWATGAAPHHLANTVLPKRGLAVSSDGWIEVNPTLQSRSHPNVFAAGDCSSFVNPLPKAGIFALQEGPVLAENMERFARQQSLIEFQPDLEDLQFLGCGDGTAMGFAFGLVLRGEWVYQIKLAMDRRHFLTLTGGSAVTRGSGKHIHEENSPYHSNQEMLRRVEKMPTREAGKMLTQIDVNNYQEAWAILERMSFNKEYRQKVMKEYNRFASAEHRGTEKRRKKESGVLPSHFSFLQWLLPVKNGAK